MKIYSLLAGLPHEGIKITGDLEQQVKDLTYDSRQVQPGALFFAVPGFRTDGHLYVQDAISRGAVAVVHEKPLELPSHVTGIQVSDVRKAMGLISANFFDYPARKLHIVGVTGTKGKTTTTYLTKALLETAGYKVGLIGTNQNMIGERILDAQRTTPESLDLQRLFHQMVGHGCSFVVMEVSSHALELGRTIGTEFDAAVFTNLSRDHLDFHGTLDKYFAAKAKLFTELGKGAKQAFAVINSDDPYGRRLTKMTNVETYTYGIQGPWDVRADDVNVSASGVTYVLHLMNRTQLLQLHLTGKFNVYNSLAAAAVGFGFGIPIEAIIAGLSQVQGVAGRFERVNCGQDFTVVVDYAHTPDSLANVLETARSLTEGRIICVFGCGGDRDKGKRPQMGDVAGRLADYVIITSDNPRSEDPAEICRDIEVGITQNPSHAPYEVIVDRREAIFRAINMARPQDLVLIAGKGHETYQIFADRTIHFDDREVARAAIAAARSGQ